MPSNSPEYMKEWYEKNRNKHLGRYKERVYCPYCNREVTRSAISNHNKTQKHALNVKINEYNKKI